VIQGQVRIRCPFPLHSEGEFASLIIASIMYETEANPQNKSRDQLIPAEILSCFAESKGSVKHRTTLPWSEHCTECVWPSCYTTCDLYSPRQDGKCRRFVDGMTRIDCPETINSYLLKITFKRWAKLWTPGNVHLHSAERAQKLESRDYRIGTALSQLPAPQAVRTFAVQKRYSFKKRIASHAKPSNPLPDAFLLECYNPNQFSISLSFAIRAVGEGAEFPFQRLIELAAGFNRVRIPFSEIESIVNMSKPFNVEIVPNHDSNHLTLFFGLMDFVLEDPARADAASKRTGGARPKIKCVVWDLDNTIWDGILMEDGAEKLKIKPHIKKVLRELDERGILLSIASKNNSEEALEVLRKMEIDDLFLVPQVSWAPKSQGILEIARQLNIGIDTILFVDDSEFERSEVVSAVPDVRILDARFSMQIIEREDCDVPVTAESRGRRKMYRVDADRQNLALKFTGDYSAFLRDCDIHLNISNLAEENLERVHELTQRTNQMNFSGNRYDRDVLRGILANSWLDAYVIEVQDRFGSYGIVGFCIVDSRESLVTDLMFSCRIQAKRVEHAFLGWIIQKYIGLNKTDVWANYRKTERNAPSGRVFADLGMQEVAKVDGVSRLVFHKGQPVPDDGIVKISERTSSAVA